MNNKITIYEKPTWTTCRNLASLFRENGIEADRTNYFNEPFTVETLRNLLNKLDLQPFDILRKADTSFKELNLSKETPIDEIFAAIVKYPNLLQRPIIEIGEKAILARPIDKALVFLEGEIASTWKSEICLLFFSCFQF